MKITCNKEIFVSALNQADRITSKNPSLPVLADVLINVSQDEKNLVLASTNLDLGINILVPAKIEGSKKQIAVRASALSGFLANTASEREIKIEVVGNTMMTETKLGKASFVGSEAEDFPNIIKIKNTNNFFIEGEKITDGIRSVIYSVSTSQIKPELAGVYIYNEGESLFFVATDSFRLAEKRIKIENKENLDIGGFIIPAKNAIEIAKIFENNKNKIEIGVGSGQVSFSEEKIYLVSRSIEGTFPDYRQIIPKETKTEAVFLKEDFLRALRASVVFSDSFNQINFSFKPKEKTVVLSSKNTSVGEGGVRIPTAISGEEVDISFNHHFLSDCLGVLKSDSLSISLSGVGKAAILRGVSDGSFLYLVMPMNR